MIYACKDEALATVSATPGVLFDYLDDQASLGSHMEKPSMMMMGGSMRYRFDEDHGRAKGSVIRMEGTVLGIGLSVEETVTERDPPVRKAWETRGIPRLIILGGYRMGFEIHPDADGSRLRVFIEYNAPESVFGKVMSFLFARTYARWCVRRMATDASSHFR